MTADRDQPEDVMNITMYLKVECLSLPRHGIVSGTSDNTTATSVIL